MPAVGYRVWRSDRAWLTSPYVATMWPHDTCLTAECRSDGPTLRRFDRPHTNDVNTHDMGAPVARCGCGIYAFHDVPSMLNTIQEDWIGGAVLCWGRITIHPEGIRARYARPIALCRPAPWRVRPPAESAVAKLATDYRIPLLDVRDLAPYASEFGDCYRPTPTEISASDGRRFVRAVGNFLRRLNDVRR